jgi:GntR family transcriptional regulator
MVSALSMDDDALAQRPDLTESSDLPQHVRIAYWLERLITARKIAPGDKLPAEVDIAGALGISRMTLRQGLAAVESKGLLERRRGRFGGNFVAQPRFDFNLAGLPGFTEQMRRAHVEAGAQVVRASTKRPPPEVRLGLGLKRGQQVHEIIRIRSANGEAITLEETYFPADIFPGMLSMNLTDSLYSVMAREYGRAPHSADELIEPVKATLQQAELLGIGVEDPLLLITRTAYTVDSVPVEFSYDYFRPDRTRITMRTQVDQERIASATAIDPA